MPFFSSQILLDALARPDLFIWQGSIELPQLTAWLSQHNLHFPEDLIMLLSATGGGDFFETETILGPFGNPAHLLQTNRWLQEQGLNPAYFVFHRGLEFLQFAENILDMWC